MAGVESEPVFQDCVFAFALRRDVEASRARGEKDLKAILEEHAGKVKPIQRDELIDLDDVTHIISSTTDFPQYDAARLQMIPVVKADWVIQSLIKSKPAPIRPFTPDTRLFFSGVHLTCADIPTGDKDAIIGAVVAMGGLESSSLTKLTTHICALSMEHPKCQQAKERNIKCKIVLPHWFDDCLKLGKAIDSTPYELPNPEIFEKKPEEVVPFPMSPSIEGATTAQPNENIPQFPELPSTRRLWVFEGRVVMISQDLELRKHHREVLEELIKSGGGKITNSVHEAQIYICKYRDGRDYVFASRAEIDVGNLSWLYYLIAHNRWTSPLRRLLHYPLPRDGIPGFKEYRITLSNYGGEARTYLENLVFAAGGEFTKSMKQDNTHLITARKSSEKCSAAEEWNINMVNHLWIEESYAKCEVQPLTTPRYTHFPPRTNLGEIIGQTQFDADLLRTLYFPRDPTPSPDDPKILRPIRGNHASMSRTSDGQEDEDEAMRDVEDLPVNTRKSVTAPALRRKSKGSVVTQTYSSTTTPSTNRKTSLGKENETPSSTNSRSAKDKALTKLHDLAPDVALYEKEKKRAGKGVWGGKRAADRIEREKANKRSSSPTDVDEDELSDEEGPVPKKMKTAVTKTLPPINIRLLITGYKRWLDNVNKEDAEKKKLRDLGILVVSDPANCTHMAAPGVVRTRKFLCALASGPTIVSTDFVDSCIDDGEIPPVEDFLLRDKDHEKKFNMKLKDIVNRAKANKRRLLHNVPIYCTADIGKDLPETYESIVKANGGIFSIYRARGGSTIKPTKPEEDENPEPEPVYLITGMKPEERKLWSKFEEMARAGNMEPRIVQAEWLLDAAISQQLRWDDRYVANK